MTQVVKTTIRIKVLHYIKDKINLKNIKNSNVSKTNN